VRDPKHGKASLEETDRVLRDLTDVGPHKSVGYLPLDTLRNTLSLSPDKVASDAMSRGLAAIQFSADQCCIKSGALYVYDRASLQKLLMSSSDILKAQDWPLDPDAFVQAIAERWLPSSDPIVPIIKGAFRDSLRESTNR
jgi:hypothetical protein